MAMGCHCESGHRGWLLTSSSWQGLCLFLQGNWCCPCGSSGDWHSTHGGHLYSVKITARRHLSKCFTSSQVQPHDNVAFNIKNMSTRYTCCSKNDLFSHGSCRLLCTGDNPEPNKRNQNWVSTGAAQLWFFARRRSSWSEAGRGTKSWNLVMMPTLAWFLAGLSRSSSLGEFSGQGYESVCSFGCL